jgi:hypothetical protein
LYHAAKGSCSFASVEGVPSSSTMSTLMSETPSTKSPRAAEPNSTAAYDAPSARSRFTSKVSISA